MFKYGIYSISVTIVCGDASIQIDSIAFEIRHITTFGNTALHMIVLIIGLKCNYRIHTHLTNLGHPNIGCNTIESMYRAHFRFVS